MAGVEFSAGPPHPSPPPQPGREPNRVRSCLPPLAGRLRGVLGSHTQPRPHRRTFAQTAKKFVGCYADAIAALEALTQSGLWQRYWQSQLLTRQ